MSAARALLIELAAIGATIDHAADRLILRAGATAIPADLVSRIRNAKAELLTTLRVLAEGPADRSEREADWSERAAIIEYDGGVPREWAEGFAKLSTMPCPPAYRPQRWARLVEAAAHFIDEWAPVAKKFGWTTEQVFGVDAAAPEACQAARGLISKLDGRRIIEMYADRVVAVPRFGGSPIMIGRCEHSGRPLWELGQ